MRGVHIREILQDFPDSGLDRQCPEQMLHARSRKVQRLVHGCLGFRISAGPFGQNLLGKCHGDVRAIATGSKLHPQIFRFKSQSRCQRCPNIDLKAESTNHWKLDACKMDVKMSTHPPTIPKSSLQLPFGKDPKSPAHK